jgi:hypothetical protein
LPAPRQKTIIFAPQYRLALSKFFHAPAPKFG